MQLDYLEAPFELHEIVNYWWTTEGAKVSYKAQVTHFFDDGSVQLRIPPKPQKQWLMNHKTRATSKPIRVVLRASEVKKRLFRSTPNRGHWNGAVGMDVGIPAEKVTYYLKRAAKEMSRSSWSTQS
jgi:hypothetical protein